VFNEIISSLVYTYQYKLSKQMLLFFPS